MARYVALLGAAYAHCRDNLDAVRRLLNEFERTTLFPEMDMDLRIEMPRGLDGHPDAHAKQLRHRPGDITVTRFAGNPEPTPA